MRLFSFALACLVGLALFFGVLAGSARFAADFQTVAARPQPLPAMDAGALACDEPPGFPCI